jgi:hypothetical protein
VGELRLRALGSGPILKHYLLYSNRGAARWCYNCTRNNFLANEFRVC